MRVEYSVDLGNGRAKRNSSEPNKPQAQKPNRTRQHRLARLLALACHFDHMLRTGQASDLAELARMTGVSRARISQIMDLLLLAPAIVDRLLCSDSSNLPDRETLRRVAAVPEWERQRQMIQ